MSLFNIKKIIKFNKITFLLIILVVLLYVMPSTFSRFETEKNGDIIIPHAIYVLEDTVISETITLPKIIPSNNQYLYYFSVSNYNEERRTETNLKYDLSIRTTTNIPITYDLFKGETVNNNTSIITSNQVITDDDGTFFRMIETPTEYFSFDINKTNNYVLLITFPTGYNNSDYQDLFEMIEIKINSQQILSTD